MASLLAVGLNKSMAIEEEQDIGALRILLSPRMSSRFRSSKNFLKNFLGCGGCTSFAVVANSRPSNVCVSPFFQKNLQAALLSTLHIPRSRVLKISFLKNKNNFFLLDLCIFKNKVKTFYKIGGRREI